MSGFLEPTAPLEPVGPASHLAPPTSQAASRLSPKTSQVASHLSPPASQAVHFAWAGSDRPREGHYYRLQTPTFIVEYDNTQDGANHIHAVWRDPTRDFGIDPLRRHRRGAH
jgi:hypothetical protein